MGCSGSKKPEYEDATAAASAPSKPPTTEDAVAADDVEPEPVLPNDRLVKVREIFSAWDFNQSGAIELSEFSGATIKVGPHEDKILKTLNEMDFDGDGIVVPAEWERYFALISATLSDAEFDAVVGDLMDAGSTLVTVVRCTQLAKETSATALLEATPEDEEEAAQLAAEAAASAPEPLSSERRQAVSELFGAWDVPGKGSIPLGKLHESRLKFGPNTADIFASLAAMDADGDGSVTLAEMLGWFTVMGADLSDEQFQLLRDDLLTFAMDATLISTLTALAMADSPAGSMGALATAAGDDDDDGDMPEAPTEPVPLPPARVELLRGLYGVFATNEAGSTIAIQEMQADALINVGPNQMASLEFMQAMDANGDGKVTFEEMCVYFAIVGEEMSDDVFEVMIDEMRGSAATKSLLKLATS